MGKKNKKKIESFQKESAASRRSNDFTVMELAFLKADVMKRHGIVSNQIRPAPTASAAMTSKTRDSVNKHFSSPHKQPLQASSPLKERTIPNPPITTKKDMVAIRPPTTKELPHVSKPSMPTAGKNPLIKLRLKQSEDESFKLAATTKQQNANIDNTLIKPNKNLDVDGRSQVHEKDPKNESDVVIGFDFGTSSSKIVIRDSGRQTAYAVPFEPFACSGNNYLIPTKIFISDDGNLSLSSAQHSFGSLKINLMDNPEKIVFSAQNTSVIINAAELAAAYMALVIRRARYWFLKQMKLIYKNTNIYWHVNVGIPSRNYDDHKIRKTFQTIAMAAWRISRIDSIINIAEVKKYLKEAADHLSLKEEAINPSADEDLWLHPDYVTTHPEVIMEVVGYAHSPLRINGLHMLVDVGATTLDTATFLIRSQSGEDVFTLLATKVERYGTMELHKHRVHALKNSMQECLSRMSNIDPTLPLPDSTHYEHQLAINDLSQNDSIFFRECKKKIGELVRYTKEARDPNSAAWAAGLPVFICGGGARHPIYKDLIESLGSTIAESLTNFNEFSIKAIPKPQQLDAPELPPNEYDRLAVAYGLSFMSDEIGKVIPESKVSDIHREKKVNVFEERYVSKDMC